MTGIYAMKVGVKQRSKKSPTKSDLTFIYIPKKITDKYNITKGDVLLLVDDEQGLRLVRKEEYLK